MTSFKYFLALILSSALYGAMAKTLTILNIGCNTSLNYQVVSSEQTIKTPIYVNDENKAYRELIADNLYIESGIIRANDSKAFELEQTKHKPYPQLILVDSFSPKGQKTTTELWINKNLECQVKGQQRKCYSFNYITTPRIQICKNH